MKPIYLEARDLPDAWFQIINTITEHGRVWQITQGSYVGQKRWELDYVTVHIKYPGTRPLIPEIPPGLNIPPPVEMDYVEQYLPYLLTTHKEEGELYTYGERLVPQMDRIIQRYKENGGGSNQECISISRPEDINLEDPPCLRSIDTRIYKKECLKDSEQQALHFILYFRSWDAWNGFPANLAGLRLVQEYMAECIGVEAGEMIVSSKGLHIYDHVFDIAKLRVKE